MFGNTKEYQVLIPYDELDRLRDIEYQTSFLINNVEKEVQRDPKTLLGDKIGFKKIGYISKKDFDFFLKNLLDIDELVIKEDK